MLNANFLTIKIFVLGFHPYYYYTVKQAPRLSDVQAG